MKDILTEKTIVIPELEKLVGTGQRPYSEDDLRILRTYGGRVPNKALAKQMRRTVGAIEGKLHDLGITRRT